MTLKFSKPGLATFAAALTLRISPDGTLVQYSSDLNQELVLKTKLKKERWIHLAVVTPPVANKTDKSIASKFQVTLSMNLTNIDIFSAGLFVNGEQAVADPLIITFPKTDLASKGANVVIGDQSDKATMSWCFASAYLLALPIGKSTSTVVSNKSC